MSHVPHFNCGDSIFAYTPYACEIDIWADLFPQVIIAAPSRTGKPPEDTTAFSRSNISILPQKETGGSTVSAKLVQLLSLPGVTWNLARAMSRVDAIHVRCPGNLGLMGAVLAPLFSPYLVAKFAGQWNDYPGEPWSVKLQKRILRSFWWRGPVTVYGQWPNLPDNVVPFFSSAMTNEQLARAEVAARNKLPSNPLRLLFVGRLSKSKNVDVLLKAVADLRRNDLKVECTIVGDGPERAFLERQAAELQIGQVVIFTGAVEFERVLDHYTQADVLVLTSETEGWPKVIAEGMAFGLGCIGSNRGLMPQMLGQDRGMIVEPGDVKSLAEAIKKIVERPEVYQSMSARAAEWAQRYSLEALRDSLRALLSRSWGIAIDSEYTSNKVRQVQDAAASLRG